MRFPGRSTWALVAIAIVMLLGHICALPFHAHAGVFTAHHDHESAPPGDDSVHTASCEAVETSPSIDIPNAVEAAPQLATGSAVPQPAVAVAVPTPAASPPLFLLHAALLI
jgi:hypothetical protein